MCDPHAAAEVMQHMSMLYLIGLLQQEVDILLLATKLMIFQMLSNSEGSYITKMDMDCSSNLWLQGGRPGNQAVHFGIDGLEACALPAVKEWLKEKQSINELIKRQLY